MPYLRSIVLNLRNLTPYAVMVATLYSHYKRRNRTFKILYTCYFGFPISKLIKYLLVIFCIRIYLSSPGCFVNLPIDFSVNSKFLIELKLSIHVGIGRYIVIPNTITVDLPFLQYRDHVKCFTTVVITQLLIGHAQPQYPC